MRLKAISFVISVVIVVALVLVLIAAIKIHEKTSGMFKFVYIKKTVGMRLHDKS